MKINSKKLRKYIIPTLCLFLVSLIIYSGYKIWDALSYFVDEEQTPVPTHYVNKIEEEYITPTIRDMETIIKPFRDDRVEITIPYYDINASKEEQEKALIYYENIYMQNTGIMYSSTDPFDVFASLDGTVKNVKEDSIMGKIVEIEHYNNITTIYQSLTDIKVAPGDKINQGEVIGSASTNTIVPNNRYCLHFEVFQNGELINPEEFYKMQINE